MLATPQEPVSASCVSYQLNAGTAYTTTQERGSSSPHINGQKAEEGGGDRV